MCDRFVHSSVIGGHHIYKDVLQPPLERHSRAKENYIDNSFTVAWTSLFVVTIPPEDNAPDKLPVGDDKGVLTSRLEYSHRAISLPGVQQKI